jgi:hypothetical protein
MVRSYCRFLTIQYQNEPIFAEFFWLGYIPHLGKPNHQSLPLKSSCIPLSGSSNRSSSFKYSLRELLTLWSMLHRIRKQQFSEKDSYLFSIFVRPLCQPFRWRLKKKKKTLKRNGGIKTFGHWKVLYQKRKHIYPIIFYIVTKLIIFSWSYYFF